MPFTPVNPIDTPYGQFLYNCPYPRKPLCSVPFGHIARGSGQLSSSKKASVLCSLWTHRPGVRTTVPIQESLCALFPLDTSPGGQDNCPHPRKPLCSVPFGHIARGSGQLNGSKGRCEVNHVYLSTVCTSLHLYPFN
ncbi:hypothetical protein AVEN_230406-1 [Araneus ventricosus]|uniref:Uncharacterized protein n=1 Tax=Araneus ventricosus TaxID=182803 RepID=A0A4Y2GPW1_ARAVE|nr:hypothetical protein AVEN_226315-1 [Araneus ventricosus]GBM54169.1 hypothetical protein AVEN_230406-1 [Araneus ventricosus]